MFAPDKYNSSIRRCKTVDSVNLIVNYMAECFAVVAEFDNWRGKVTTNFLFTNDKVIELEETSSGTRFAHKELSEPNEPRKRLNL